MVEGQHPKTLKPYWWRGDETPATIGAQNLTPVTTVELDDFFDALEWYLVEVVGAEIVEHARGATGSNAEVWQDGLSAPSLAAVERALSSIPNGAS